jgi:hypothetical protein
MENMQQYMDAQAQLKGISNTSGRDSQIFADPAAAREEALQRLRADAANPALPDQVRKDLQTMADGIDPEMQKEGPRPLGMTSSEIRYERNLKSREFMLAASRLKDATGVMPETFGGKQYTNEQLYAETFPEPVAPVVRSVAPGASSNSAANDESSSRSMWSSAWSATKDAASSAYKYVADSAVGRAASSAYNYVADSAVGRAVSAAVDTVKDSYNAVERGGGPRDADAEGYASAESTYLAKLNEDPQANSGKIATVQKYGLSQAEYDSVRDYQTNGASAPAVVQASRNAASYFGQASEYFRSQGGIANTVGAVSADLLGGFLGAPHRIAGYTDSPVDSLAAADSGNWGTRAQGAFGLAAPFISADAAAGVLLSGGSVTGAVVAGGVVTAGCSQEGGIACFGIAPSPSSLSSITRAATSQASDVAENIGTRATAGVTESPSFARGVSANRAPVVSAGTDVVAGSAATDVVRADSAADTLAVRASQDHAATSPIRASVAADAPAVTNGDVRLTQREGVTRPPEPQSVDLLERLQQRATEGKSVGLVGEAQLSSGSAIRGTEYQAGPFGQRSDAWTSSRASQGEGGASKSMVEDAYATYASKPVPGAEPLRMAGGHDAAAAYDAVYVRAAETLDGKPVYINKSSFDALNGTLEHGAVVNNTYQKLSDGSAYIVTPRVVHVPKPATIGTAAAEDMHFWNAEADALQERLRTAARGEQPMPVRDPTVSIAGQENGTLQIKVRGYDLDGELLPGWSFRNGEFSACRIDKKCITVLTAEDDKMILTSVAHEVAHSYRSDLIEEVNAAGTAMEAAQKAIQGASAPIQDVLRDKLTDSIRRYAKADELTERQAWVDGIRLADDIYARTGVNIFQGWTKKELEDFLLSQYKTYEAGMTDNIRYYYSALTESTRTDLLAQVDASYSAGGARIREALDTSPAVSAAESELRVTSANTKGAGGASGSTRRDGPSRSASDETPRAESEPRAPASGSDESSAQAKGATRRSADSEKVDTNTSSQESSALSGGISQPRPSNLFERNGKLYYEQEGKAVFEVRTDAARTGGRSLFIEMPSAEGTTRARIDLGYDVSADGVIQASAVRGTEKVLTPGVPIRAATLDDVLAKMSGVRETAGEIAIGIVPPSKPAARFDTLKDSAAHVWEPFRLGIDRTADSIEGTYQWVANAVRRDQAAPPASPVAVDSASRKGSARVPFPSEETVRNIARGVGYVGIGVGGATFGTAIIPGVRGDEIGLVAPDSQRVSSTISPDAPGSEFMKASVSPGQPQPSGAQSGITGSVSPSSVNSYPATLGEKVARTTTPAKVSVAPAAPRSESTGPAAIPETDSRPAPREKDMPGAQVSATTPDAHSVQPVGPSGVPLPPSSPSPATLSDILGVLRSALGLFASRASSSPANINNQSVLVPVQTVLAAPVPASAFPQAPRVPLAPSISVDVVPSRVPKGTTALINWKAEGESPGVAFDCAVVDDRGVLLAMSMPALGSVQTQRLMESRTIVVGCKQAGGVLGTKKVTISVIGDTAAPALSFTAGQVPYSTAGVELVAALTNTKPGATASAACEASSIDYFTCLSLRMKFVGAVR